MALVDAYTITENYSAALDVLGSLPIAMQHDTRFRVRAALCYLAQADYDNVRKIYGDVMENDHSFHGLLVTVQLALSLGEVEEAIDLMERAVESKSWLQFQIRFRFRHNDAVKDHPRYLALLKRIGLDDESVAALNERMSLN